ncbi:nucleotide pyrophosphohydrolase [Erysipelothrix aquatica]|uniref:nucleotide pyrophosphohydrolase n=1 Tax=Erysipelothrix aquatica TaxID=2683714 RepID=UPI00135A8C5C|nr:nucleotide pyrophosphohydrolase [Erysipelothrix aquatica]
MYSEIVDMIIKFRDDRNWQQFHNPKDLALSISLEAAELLEVFQWSGGDTSINGNKDRVQEELADILIYCVLMAEACGLDIEQLIKNKLLINSSKYPIEKSYGKKEKYSKL